MAVPVYDNHLHLSPLGRNIDAAREYEDAGGTGMTLVTLPYSCVTVRCGDDFADSFGVTLSLAQKTRERTNLNVNVAVGPYPLYLMWLAEHIGLEEAENAMMRGMEIAADMVADGKANAIGEIGRPHFPVGDARISEASDRILLRGMELAKENDCPVIIHCESEPGTFDSLADLADLAHLPREMVVKHSSLPVTDMERNSGLMPSIPASRNLIKEAISQSDRFMVETDFIDDPEKPNAIMAVTTVPKRIKGYLDSGTLTEEQVHRICGDIPSRLYERHR